MMDVTFVLEESGVSATVEVPCDVDVAAAKEVACTALAVSPASVEMRIGTQVLEETCRLQDTAFESGVQVVLSPRCADIRCPDEYKVETGEGSLLLTSLSLSRCGTLCIYLCLEDSFSYIGGFDTETFKPLFWSKADFLSNDIPNGPPAISRCKTRCYLPYWDLFREVALPGGEVLRKVEGASKSVFACGSVVVSQGKDGVSVYDEDLTLLRSLSHKGCEKVAVSHCGGWVITSSTAENTTRVWDVNTGVNVALVPVAGCVAVSQSASAFAVGDENGRVHLFDWSGVGLGSVDVDNDGVQDIRFTPCGKYFVANVVSLDPQFTANGVWSRKYFPSTLHQYAVANMSCVRAIPIDDGEVLVAVSPCSRVVVSSCIERDTIMTTHLHPHSE